jgi:hypothetical protein
MKKANNTLLARIALGLYSWNRLYLARRPLVSHLIDLYLSQFRWKNGEKARTH